MPENEDVETEVVAPVVDETVDEVVEPTEDRTYSQSDVEKLRAEAAKHRTEKQAEKARVEALEAKLKVFEDAQLTETERTAKELETTRTRADVNQSRAQELEVKFQLALAAVNPANEIGDVNAAIKLIDRDTLEFDSAGKITNLSDALDILKSTYPSVVAKQGSAAVSAPNTGVTNPAKPTGDKKLTRGDLKGLSPKKISELYDSGKLGHLF